MKKANVKAILLLLIVWSYSSCTKPHQDKNPHSLKFGFINFEQSFSMDEIIDQLPKTILYNLGNELVF